MVFPIEPSFHISCFQMSDSTVTMAKQLLDCSAFLYFFHFFFFFWLRFNLQIYKIQTKSCLFLKGNTKFKSI
jgi:hypothetical protein